MKDWNYENEQWTKLPIYLRHLPIFTRHFDFFSYLIRFLWFLFLKFLFFRFYIRLKVIGDMKAVFKNHPKLIVISNHASHLDAISISSSIPFRYWLHVYFAAAKDYFFSGFWMTFFSKHCIGAIPIDRKDRKGEAVKLCITLLTRLTKIWLVMFPEGTRSRDGMIHPFKKGVSVFADRSNTRDGMIHPFKKGVSVFADRSNTSILFLYLEGNYDLWPKEASFARMGKLTVHVGPVHPPAHIQIIDEAYRNWVNSIGVKANFAPRREQTPS